MLSYITGRLILPFAVSHLNPRPLESSTPVFSIRIPQSTRVLLHQASLHFCDCQWEEDKAENEQEDEVPEQVYRDEPERERPDECHQIGEW